MSRAIRNSDRKTTGAFEWLFAICFAAGILCSLILAMGERPVIYELLPLLPLSFSVFCTLLLAPLFLRDRSWTILIVYVCCFLRYVVLPVILCSDPCYSISLYQPTSQGVGSAILFMVYELLFICIGFAIYGLVVHKRIDSKAVSAMQEPAGVVFALFVFAALVIFVVFPESRQGLSFISIDAGTGARMGGVKSTFGNVTRQLVLIGMLMAFVLFSTWCSRKASETGSERYYWMALIAALLCVCVVVDEKRSVQVYSAFAVIVLLTKLFPGKARRTVGLVAGLAFALVALLTIYKNFYVFNYASYADALANSNGFAGVGKTAELYLLGPVSVAAGLNETLADAQSLGSLLYDFARSFIGLSFFVKGSDFTAAGAMFNQFVSGGTSASGVLLPISVEGGTCTFLALGPALTLGFLLFALYLERKMRNATSPVVIFYIAYVYIRMATCLVSAAVSSVILSFSSVIVIVGALWLAQRLLSKKGRVVQ